MHDEYDSKLGLPIAFPERDVPGYLSRGRRAAGLAQFRTAETEKYAHVTFFFNGGREEPFAREERRLVPSPKDVATYDLKPEMRADDVADGVVAAIESEGYAFVLVNFANPDMVGHTGVLAGGDHARSNDRRVHRAHHRWRARTRHGGGDHGRPRQLRDDGPRDGHPHTAHTTNPVPLLRG